MGVNWVEYYPHSDKPHILTTSDDKTVKVWDYTSKQLVATLEGHTANGKNQAARSGDANWSVSFACYHPELPIVIAWRGWHGQSCGMQTRRGLEQTLNYGLERACVRLLSKRQAERGHRASMRAWLCSGWAGRSRPRAWTPSGKITYAKHTDIVTTTIKKAGWLIRASCGLMLMDAEKDMKDGEQLAITDQGSRIG